MPPPESTFIELYSSLGCVYDASMAPIQIVYAVAADAPIHRHVENTIPAVIRQDQRFVHSQTGLYLNIAKRIQFVRLHEDSATLASLGVMAEASIASQVPAHAVVFYDGFNIGPCAAGQTVAALFLHGYDTRTGASCWLSDTIFLQNPWPGLGFWEITVLHELGHTFGLGHVADRHDIMCGDPTGWLWPIRMSPEDVAAFRPWLVS